MRQEGFDGGPPEGPFGESPVFELLPQRSGGQEAQTRAVHVLDHDSDVLLFVFDFLSTAGFRMSASSTVGDALAYIGRHHPEVVIASMEMPELTGMDLVQRIRDLSPSTQVLLTSWRTEGSADPEFLREGGADLIGKPIQKVALLRAVERAASR